MKISVRRSEAADLSRWDKLVEVSNEGTIFHRLDFLEYHGDRFRESEHHLVFQNGGALLGVLPLVIREEEGVLTARSPYGGSMGGPAFDRVLTYGESMDAVALLLDYLRGVAVPRFVLTLPTQCCHRVYSESWRLALLERGFKCVNRDISSVIRIEPGINMADLLDSSRRNQARKAEKSGVEIRSRAPLEDFWRVLMQTYEKLGKNPTHTMTDLSWLAAHHPTRVHADVAYHDGIPVAGVCYFVLNARATSTFYICQDPAAQHLQANSLLLLQGMVSAQRDGFRWLDLGTSSVAQAGRANLFLFKESFGAVGEFRETYQWTAA